MRLKELWQNYQLRQNFESVLIYVKMRLDIDQINTKLKTNFNSVYDLYSTVYPLTRKSTQDTFKITTAIHKEQKFMNKIVTKMLKPITYPLIIQILCILLMIYFSLSLKGLVVSMLSDFNSDLTQIYGITTIFHTILWIYFLFIVLIITCLFSYQSHKVWFWIVATRYSKVFKRVNTIRFVNLFLDVYSVTLDTKTTLLEMRNIYENTCLSWLVYHVTNSLERGEYLFNAFDSLYFDETLSMMLVQCNLNDNILTAFEEYQIYSETLLMKSFSSGGRLLMIISYLLVGVTLLGFYTALMLPMKILEVL